MNSYSCPSWIALAVILLAGHAEMQRGHEQGPSGSSNSGGQQPRRRAGRPILPVENPGGGALTQEQLRLVRRRMHNRESARRSRSKRQATYEEQSDKVRHPTTQKNTLSF